MPSPSPQSHDATPSDGRFRHGCGPGLVCVGLVVLRDQAHGGGLPGAVGYEEADPLAAVDRKRHAVDRGHVGESLGDALYREERHTRRSARVGGGDMLITRRGVLQVPLTLLTAT